MKASSVCWTSL